MSSSIAPPPRVFYGTLIHSTSITSIEYLHQALLGVSAAGVIVFLERDVEPSAVASRIAARGWRRAELIKLGLGEFLMPGLIDTHTHAPQVPNAGYGQQYELLDWLTNVTFPTEAKFSDAQYARRTYESVVQRTINAGTTTCCYYGTIHQTTKILAAICHRKGQRAFVGKCNMDRESAPNYTESSSAKSIEDTKEFVKFVRTHCVSPTVIAGLDGQLPLTTSTPPISPIGTGNISIASLSISPLSTSDADEEDHPIQPRSRTSSLSNGNAGKLAKNMFSKTSLVQPILTPRFAISCTDELLADLGKMLSKDPTLALQTHLAENLAEITFTKKLFPFAETYTSIYDHFKLLRPNTILAHCTHLEDSELELIKDRESGISHCPTSNTNLRSGLSKVGRMLDRGIKVSLGTDVSGGYGLGILTALRQASVVSKSLIMNTRDHPPLIPATDVGAFESSWLSMETLFYMATLGGAEVTCLEDRIGNFIVGKEFDALLINTGQQLASSDPALSPDAEYDDEEETIYEDMPDTLLQGGNPALFVEPEDGIEKLFEKFLFAGDDRNISSTFVRGRRIGGSHSLLPSPL